MIVAPIEKVIPFRYAPDTMDGLFECLTVQLDNEIIVPARALFEVLGTDWPTSRKMLLGRGVEFRKHPVKAGRRVGLVDCMTLPDVTAALDKMNPNKAPSDELKMRRHLFKVGLVREIENGWGLNIAAKSADPDTIIVTDTLDGADLFRRDASRLGMHPNHIGAVVRTGGFIEVVKPQVATRVKRLMQPKGAPDSFVEIIEQRASRETIQLPLDAYAPGELERRMRDAKPIVPADIFERKASDDPLAQRRVLPRRPDVIDLNPTLDDMNPDRWKFVMLPETVEKKVWDCE
jgi:hypothetical protein